MTSWKMSQWDGGVSKFLITETIQAEVIRLVLSGGIVIIPFLVILEVGGINFDCPNDLRVKHFHLEGKS